MHCSDFLLCPLTAHLDKKGSTVNGGLVERHKLGFNVMMMSSFQGPEIFPAINLYNYISYLCVCMKSLG